MAKEGSIFLNLIRELSPKKINAIISFFKDPQKILQVKRKDLEEVPGLTNKDIETILKRRSSDILDEELKLIKSEGIRVIDLFDKDYPQRLKEISYPPLVLYIKGDTEVLNKLIFAIVGTRLPTRYGVGMAEKFAYELSLLGLVIVSGLARGIDTAVHKQAIKDGESIAVLGSGFKHIYPRENHGLARAIAKKGAVISEFPLKQPPFKENFPRRNRIISGTSKGVLVVEAGLRSGALITARRACEQNREVFALPGEADSPVSRGTHLLIKEGAKLVDSVEDILEELNIKFETDTTVCSHPLLDRQEKVIFDIIDREGMCLEEIFGKSHIDRPLLGKIISKGYKMSSESFQLPV